jgi:hypothetical protein
MYDELLYTYVQCRVDLAILINEMSMMLYATSRADP